MRLTRLSKSTIRELPLDIELSAVAERQVRAVRTGEARRRAGAGGARSECVRAPIPFLDYESANRA